jgi:hypothetical protein
VNTEVLTPEAVVPTFESVALRVSPDPLYLGLPNHTDAECTTTGVTSDATTATLNPKSELLNVYEIVAFPEPVATEQPVTPVSVNVPALTGLEQSYHW